MFYGWLIGRSVMFVRPTKDEAEAAMRMIRDELMQKIAGTYEPDEFQKAANVMLRMIGIDEELQGELKGERLERAEKRLAYYKNAKLVKITEEYTPS